MLEYYRKMEECKSVKKILIDSDTGISNALEEVEKLELMIANLKNEKAMINNKNDILKR